jgi:ring-1,2-phenylacetyl-CoA epoxidase subunit PaaC
MVQTAVNELWMFTGELFEASVYEQQMIQQNIAPDPDVIKAPWNQKIQEVLKEATLIIPNDQWMQNGGKTGRHSEKLGYILAELQYMQRAFPGMEW